MHHQYWNSELSCIFPDLVSDESSAWNFCPTVFPKILLVMHHQYWNSELSCIFPDLVSDESSAWNFCPTVFPKILLVMHHQYWNSELSCIFPDLVSDESTAWNFCTFSSDVILWRNQWWRHKMLAHVLSGYFSVNELRDIPHSTSKANNADRRVWD